MNERASGGRSNRRDRRKVGRKKPPRTARRRNVLDRFPDIAHIELARATNWAARLEKRRDQMPNRHRGSRLHSTAHGDNDPPEWCQSTAFFDPPRYSTHLENPISLISCNLIFGKALMLTSFAVEHYVGAI